MTTATGASTEEQALTPVEARVGPEEESNMMPAVGKEPDPDQPPPNGDHAPIWQNCGFYPKLVNNENAVHSLDHGVVWITYRPGLPQKQI